MKGILDRSDGAKKFYWLNDKKELVTLLLEPRGNKYGTYDMTELRVHGKAKFYKNDATGRIIHNDR